jgi:hypothetical protein
MPTAPMCQHNVPVHRHAGTWGHGIQAPLAHQRVSVAHGGAGVWPCQRQVRGCKGVSTRAGACERAGMEVCNCAGAQARGYVYWRIGAVGCVVHSQREATP